MGVTMDEFTVIMQRVHILNKSACAEGRDSFL